MADSNISVFESSQQDGQPLELYKFVNNGVSYQYTSNVSDIDIKTNDGGITATETYVAEYIERESIKPSSSGDSTALIVTVSKDHAIAKKFQGAPPEKKIMLTVIRLHEQDHTKFDKVFYGRVSQASFDGSQCKLTVKMENWLSKELPNGDHRFTCNNVLFDEDCQLLENDYKIDFFIDSVVGVDIYSTTFAGYADGYFVGGFIRHANGIRQITAHVGNKVTVKYPFAVTPANGAFVLPGCDHLFKTCALKFHNNLNFTGFPYVPPTDSTRNPVGGGVYWVDSLVIRRDTDGFIGTISV